MISVLPIKYNIKEVYSNNGLVFNENCYGVRAAENGTELGYALFFIENNCLTLLKLVPENDLSMADAVLRSALFFGVNRNVIKATYSDCVNEITIRKLGFIDEKSDRTILIDKLFDTCSCKNDK